MTNNDQISAQPLTDENAMTRIANLLGRSPEWSSAADFLTDIADIVHYTGRQHPGDADPETYNPHRPT